MARLCDRFRQRASATIAGPVAVGVKGAGAATETLLRSRIARSILRRWPSKIPRSFRSWSCQIGENAGGMCQIPRKEADPYVGFAEGGQALTGIGSLDAKLI